MEKDTLKTLEALTRGGVTIGGDLVLEKHVEYEVNNVEDGGIGIQINNTSKKAAGMKPDNRKDPAKPMNEALMTDEAKKYWQRLQEKSFVDADYRLMPTTTRKQAMYIAEAFAEKLQLSKKWKLFQDLWGISNLAQEKWDIQQTGILPPRSEEINELFSE